MEFTQASVPQGDDLTLVWDESRAVEGLKVFLGNSVTGKYLEQKEVKTMNGMTLLYKLQVEGQEKLLVVWGTKGLNDLFSRGNGGQPIPVGAMVKIDYAGKRQLDGGRSFHDFKIGFFMPTPEFQSANTDAPVSEITPETIPFEGKTAGY